MTYVSVNRFGDLVCPTCEAVIKTPPDFRVRAGLSQCPLCRKPFQVSESAAAEANDLLYGRGYDDGNLSVIVDNLINQEDPDTGLADEFVFDLADMLMDDDV